MRSVLMTSVTAVNLEASNIVPAFEVVLYGPFLGVDKGETHLAPGISKSFWSLTNTPASLTDPDKVIFVVGVMEKDDGNPEALRVIVKGAVTASLASSFTFSRNDKVIKLLNDINSAIGTPTGFPNFDDKVGIQQLRFSLGELNSAEAGQAIEKTLNFIGDGGNYSVKFTAQNPVPFKGDLLWYKHTGWTTGTGNWATGSPHKVGNGWQGFNFVFATSDGVLYGVQPNGDLIWYRHKKWEENGDGGWEIGSGSKVGNIGQSLKFVFATSNGVFYVVRSNGDLIWFNHTGYLNGAQQWAIGNDAKVGNGWQGFKFVFATSGGIIYGIQPSGILQWYKHNGWLNGAATWANSGNAIVIGNSWHRFLTVFATRQGIIYGIEPNGDLKWYKHIGWNNGNASWENNGNPMTVGNSWQNLLPVLATSRAPITAGEASQWDVQCVIYGIIK